MRAAYDAICHYHGLHIVGADELDDRSTYSGVVAHVCFIRVPPCQLFRLPTFTEYDPDGHLRGPSVIGSVECHRGDWVATKTLAGPILQSREIRTSLGHLPAL